MTLNESTHGWPNRFLIACCCLVATLGCSSTVRQPAWIATGSRGMVASDSEFASRAGLEILRQGGNAFDAAAAVSFALAVTRPQSTGIGGGGFLIAWKPAGEEIVVSDFRESAPAASTPLMYAQAVKRHPGTPTPSRYGALAVAVPGIVAGRAEMLHSHGTMSLAEVLAPAIRLARDGFPVDQHYIDACVSALEIYDQYPSLIESCNYVYRTHIRSGILRKQGEDLVQPELAHLLETLAANGASVFYKGPIAEALVRANNRHGGILSKGDFADYRVRNDRPPVVFSYRHHTVIAMPPPSSGGICLAETLNILESFDLPKIHADKPALARHYFVEAMKHAFADRARWLGDPDFAPIPVGLLTAKGYGQQLAFDIDADHCSDPETYGAVQIPDDAGTSHFCIVDQWGNCVVSTETVNTEFGSLFAVDEWGLILNNEMDDFAAEAGVANIYGLVQSKRNGVEAGKRPLSSMSPTIVLKDGKPVLLLGGSGGPRIISSVLNVLLNVVDFGMPLQDAMTTPRIHHQWQPDQVFFDKAPPSNWTIGLTARGHKLSEQCKTGIIQAILIQNGELTGASDPRKGGRPAGD